MAEERLQKILARAGVASRRMAEAIIAQGRVRVDGVVVDQPGAKADPARQRVEVDGRHLDAPERLEYWVLNKPLGVVSTVRDPEGRRRVVDLLPPEAAGRLYPVGRLDVDSEGLMLLTNDGDLALRMTHPRFGVKKTYRVWVRGVPDKATLERLRRGVDVDGQLTAPAQATWKGGEGGRSKLRLVLGEGRKREVRRMCEAVGLSVLRLLRTGLGPLRLGEMPIGACRHLSPGEVWKLKEAVGLNTPNTSCKAGGDGVKKSSRRATETRGGPRKPGEPMKAGRADSAKQAGNRGKPEEGPRGGSKGRPGDEPGRKPRGESRGGPKGGRGPGRKIEGR